MPAKTAAAHFQTDVCRKAINCFFGAGPYVAVVNKPVYKGCSIAI